MKKGFTLVELIGVIVIVGLLIIVGVPEMTRTLKKTNDDEEQRALVDLYLATENYVQVNRENFPTLKNSGGETYISLNELKKAGYLRANMVNPQTEEVFDYNTAVRVFRNNDDTLDYEYNKDYYGVDSYVSDSLLVHYDALNNQGIGVYDASAKTWKDLSDKINDGTINGAKLQDNTVYYDGVDDYTQVNKTLDFSTGQTLEINVKFNTVSAKNFFGNLHTSNGSGLSINSSTKFQYSVNGTSHLVYSDGNVQSGTIYTIVGTYDGSNIILYVNGEEVKRLSYSGSIATSTIPLTIGADPNATGFDSFAEVSVQNVLIYNRALTATEVKDNYKIDKLRFNM